MAEIKLINLISFIVASATLHSMKNIKKNIINYLTQIKTNFKKFIKSLINVRIIILRPNSENLLKLKESIQISYNKLKTIYKLDIFISTLGVTCYFFGYYFITIYALVHLIVRVLQTFSKTFANKLISFKKDQITIKDHYLKDFKVFYYLVFVIRLITFLVYFYFFSLDVEKMNNVAGIFYAITYVFIIVGFIDIGITLYIIFYKNNPVIEVAANVCYHCATKALPLVGALHVSSYVPFISPNPVSNGYHKFSPLGRGYGAYSTEQLLQIDHLKTNLGKNFNYHEIIDTDKMVDPTKLKTYAQKNGVNVQTLLDLAISKPKNS